MMKAIDELYELLNSKHIDYGNLLCDIQAEYDALVKALEWALDVLNTIQPSMTVPDKDIEMLAKGNQALAAAKGKPK